MPDQDDETYRITLGPRERRITVRCQACYGAVETTREDTRYCSPRCRQRARRHLLKWGTPITPGSTNWR